MELIKKLGTKFIGGKWRRIGVFSCPFCLQKVERTLSDGEKCISCGCHKNVKHGDFGTKLYNVWCDMKQRCYNSKHKRYKDYGGRGITICPEWANDYTKFRDWALSHGYKENLQINRIENDGNYEPSNCNWVTRTENINNRRNTISKELIKQIEFSYNTEEYTRKDLAIKYNVSITTIRRILSKLIGGI